MPARQRGPGLRGWPGSAAAFRSSRARRLQRPTALALPLREAPEVAAYAARVDLATREVHVRVADEPLLVPGERHPLREHVVGVRQAALRDRAREIRELHAVLAEEAAGLRDVGDDRLVRVDQVGVRGAGASVAARLARHATEDPDEAEVAVHRPLLLVH